MNSKKLYILRPIHIKGDDPWEPWYDRAFGFIVCADDEAEARKLADGKAGEENEAEFIDEEIVDTKRPWLDPKYSTCKELTPIATSEVIMRDFAAA